MNLGLRADIDNSSGFCFGVVNAIKKAEEILSEGKKLFCLGQIVHNDEEVTRLEQMGMITLAREDIESIRNQTVLIRAHGEPPETYEILRRGENEIIDATCPIVIKLQNRVQKSSDEGKTILIFGKDNHPEVVGLKGHINQKKQVVFENFEDLDLENLPRKITLYSQTTRSLEKLYEMKQRLEEEGFEVDFKDTVCRKVSGRGEELRVFASNYDKIVFVSGRNSSNGKVLFDICQEVNRDSHKIASPGEINPGWFNKGDSVGICGATSTPRWLMEEVRRKLLEL
jgi:4-hydroxy-3-methylbut-2-enyl diphosphate reductase